MRTASRFSRKFLCAELRTARISKRGTAGSDWHVFSRVLSVGDAFARAFESLRFDRTFGKPLEALDQFSDYCAMSFLALGPPEKSQCVGCIELWQDLPSRGSEPRVAR